MVAGIGTLTAALLAAVGSAWATPQLGLGGGSDWYAGPGGERLGSLLGFVAASQDRASLALGALRYRDNLVGDGNGALLVAGAPLGAVATARAWGTRFVGDGSFRAWRVKAGPELDLRARRTLGLYFQHDQNNLGGDSNGGIAELAVPCAARLVARLSGGIAAESGGGHSSQGTLGLTWQPRPRLEVAIDAGLAHSGALDSSPIAGGTGRGGGPLGGLPIIGGPNDSRVVSPGVSSSTRTEGVMSLGLRAYFP